MTFEELIVKMVRSAITLHGSDRRTFSGKQVSSSLYPIDHVLVKLPPTRQLALARGEFRLPREVDGIPLHVSEKPSVLNKPSSRYIISAMCHYSKGDRIVGSVGRGALDNPDEKE